MILHAKYKDGNHCKVFVIDTYALSPTNKVTIKYGKPCIYLCNPDSDIFNSNNFRSFKRSWLEDNLFGGEPIYLEVNFINGVSLKQYSKFAGDIKCKNILDLNLFHRLCKIDFR